MDGSLSIYLYKNYNLIIVIMAINPVINKNKSQIKFIKEKNIRQVAAIIKNLDIFISNDTGIMHLASAVGLPVLSFFGDTDPIQWAPRGKYDKYLLGRDNKVENISVEKAYNTFLKMINDINFLKTNNE